MRTLAAGAGAGLKPSDHFAAPLCRRHHAEGHSRGWRSFEAKYGIDLVEIASILAVRPPCDLF